MNQPGPAAAQDDPLASLALHRPGKLALVLTAVGAVAVLIRAAFFAQLLHQFPLYGTTLPGYDQHLYNTWAQAIAAGDWLSSSQGVFYGSPLYPYLLAVVYRLAGPGNVAAGIVLNGLFGVGAAILAAVLGARLFGRWGGLAAGLLMALNGSQLSVEAMLLGDSLVPAFCLGALYLVVRYLEQDRGAHAVPFWVWLVPGLLLGLAVLAKGTVLLAAAALCVTVALRGLRARRWRSATSGAIMCAGVCLVLAAPILRNGLMYGRWTVALNGPVTLYIGNVPGATGVSVYPPDFEQTIKRFQKTGAPASAWLDKLQEELRAHPGALRAVLLRKTLLVLNSWDAPDNGNYYFVRRYVLPLRAFTFGPLFLYVIGFLGIGLTVRRWRELAPLYAFAAFLGVGLILVLVAGRYKLPFLALLAVFGGGAASVLAQHLRARHYGVVAVSALAAAALACVFWPRGPIGVPRSWSELRPKEFLNNAMLLAAEGREDEARHILEEGLAVFQDDPWFAEPLAGLYLKAGQPERAVAVTEAALAHGVVTQHILERRLLAYRALSLTDKARAAAGELAARYPESALLNSAEPGNPSAPGRR